MIRRLVLAFAVTLAITSLSTLAQDDGSIAFPAGFRDWYQHHTTVNLKDRPRAKSAFRMSM